MHRLLRSFMLLGVLQCLPTSADGKQVKTYTTGHREIQVQSNLPQSQSLEHILTSALQSMNSQSLGQSLEHQILSSSFGSNIPQSQNTLNQIYHFDSSFRPSSVNNQHQQPRFRSAESNYSPSFSFPVIDQHPNQLPVNPTIAPPAPPAVPASQHGPSFPVIDQHPNPPPVNPTIASPAPPVPAPQHDPQIQMKLSKKTPKPVNPTMAPPAPSVPVPQHDPKIKQITKKSISNPNTQFQTQSHTKITQISNHQRKSNHNTPPPPSPNINRNVQQVLKTPEISSGIERNSFQTNTGHSSFPNLPPPRPNFPVLPGFHSSFPTLPPRRPNFPVLPSFDNNWPSSNDGFPSLGQGFPQLPPLPSLPKMHTAPPLPNIHIAHNQAPLLPQGFNRPKSEMNFPPQLAHLFQKIDEKDIPNVNSTLGEAPQCFNGQCSCAPLHKYDGKIGRCIHKGSVHRECRENEFKCLDGRCVAGHFRCNGLAECMDGTDEMDCSLRNCTETQFQCANGICIDYYGGRCNNILNCMDGSDEIGCEDCSMTGGCDDNAKCVRPRGTMIHMCKCNVGFAGDGEMCGPDQDLDSYPDYDLNCTDVHCRMDNCPSKPNSGQEDMDGDGVGDVCKSLESIVELPDVPPCNSTNTTNCNPDIDDDGIDNIVDNCPDISNMDQMNSDNDTLGDACDNCPYITNEDQEDSDQDVVGDVCDNDNDKDRDGIQDDIDNCPDVPNADQVNSDDDDMGNACDDDADNDGVLNENDNCWLVPNPDQRKNAPCLSDSDNDGISNYQDNCPNNSRIAVTDFRTFARVVLDPIEYSQIDPNWVIKDKGAEITQTENCDPGLFYGKAVFDGVDFDGTFYIDDHSDDDYAGFVFSYQSNSRFYMMQWKKRSQTYWEPKPFTAKGEPAITLKRVNSTTGPGPTLRNAIWHTGTVPGQTELLWTDPRNVGWEPEVAYRWQLLHRPQIGLIRMYVLKGADLVADSGNIFDDEIKGGRLGVFVFSQEDVIWSNIGYRCNDKVRQEVYDDLPVELQMKVDIDHWW